MKTSLITSALALVAIAAALVFSSCTPAMNSALSGVITSGLTGQPIPSTPVQRAGDVTAPPVLVSSSDLALAEAGDPKAVHGLYDAGYLVAKARETVISATK